MKKDKYKAMKIHGDWYVMKKRKLFFFFNWYFYSDFIRFSKEKAEEICHLLNNPELMKERIKLIKEEL